jgi:hypothetical protein
MCKFSQNDLKEVIPIPEDRTLHRHHYGNTDPAMILKASLLRKN